MLLLIKSPKCKAVKSQQHMTFYIRIANYKSEYNHFQNQSSKSISINSPSVQLCAMQCAPNHIRKTIIQIKQFKILSSRSTQEIRDDGKQKYLKGTSVLVTTARTAADYKQDQYLRKYKYSQPASQPMLASNRLSRGNRFSLNNFKFSSIFASVFTKSLFTNPTYRDYSLLLCQGDL